MQGNTIITQSSVSKDDDTSSGVWEFAAGLDSFVPWKGSYAGWECAARAAEAPGTASLWRARLESA